MVQLIEQLQACLREHGMPSRLNKSKHLLTLNYGGVTTRWRCRAQWNLKTRQLVWRSFCPGRVARRCLTKAERVLNAINRQLPEGRFELDRHSRTIALRTNFDGDQLIGRKSRLLRVMLTNLTLMETWLPHFHRLLQGKPGRTSGTSGGGGAL